MRDFSTSGYFAPIFQRLLSICIRTLQSMLQPLWFMALLNLYCNDPPLTYPTVFQVAMGKQLCLAEYFISCKTQSDISLLIVYKPKTQTHVTLNFDCSVLKSRHIVFVTVMRASLQQFTHTLPPVLFSSTVDYLNLDGCLQRQNLRATHSMLQKVRRIAEEN